MKWKAITLLGLTLAVTACGRAQATQATQGRQDTQAATASCPRRAPAVHVPPAKARAGQLVRPGSVAATICQYGQSGKGKFLARLVLPDAKASAGFAAVINDSGPVSPYARRCDSARNRLPYSQYVIFRYRTGAPVRVRVTLSDCSLAVFNGGKIYEFTGGQIDADLFTMATLTPDDRGKLVPDVLGLRFDRAAAAIKAAGFTVSLDGAAIDKSARFGDVIFTSVPAGLRVSPADQQLGLVLAVRPAPACKAGQLALTYLGGEGGAGNDFGSIVVRDVSRRPCRLAWPLRISGLDTAGHRVTATVKEQVSTPAILSPGVKVNKRGLPQVGTLTVQVVLHAEYRDDPKTGGMCQPNWVVPAAWSVRLASGGQVSVANADSYDPTKLVASGGLVTCRGDLEALQPAGYANLP